MNYAVVARDNQMPLTTSIIQLSVKNLQDQIKKSLMQYITESEQNRTESKI